MFYVLGLFNQSAIFFTKWYWLVKTVWLSYCLLLCMCVLLTLLFCKANPQLSETFCVLHLFSYLCITLCVCVWMCMHVCTHTHTCMHAHVCTQLLSRNVCCFLSWSGIFSQGICCCITVMLSSENICVCYSPLSSLASGDILLHLCAATENCSCYSIPDFMKNAVSVMSV